MTMNTELKPFIDGLAHAWPEPALSLPIPVWRERAEQLSRQARQPYPEGLCVRDVIVSGGPREVTVRLYEPLQQDDRPLACLMYMHGGGWVVGSHDTHDGITAALAARTGLMVASVHYARAPEHPYPAPLEDCQTVLSWLQREGPALGVATDKLFVGGDSAGGNLATVLAWLKRNTGELRGQVLIYPCVDTDFSRPSYLSEAQAPFLKAAEMQWFWDQYCPDLATRQLPTVAPLRATDWQGMAPALVLVAEHDPLRDEGAEYARLLQQAGVPTTFRPGEGLIHGHLRAGRWCRAAADEFTAICDWLSTHAR